MLEFLLDESDRIGSIVLLGYGDEFFYKRLCCFCSWSSCPDLLVDDQADSKTSNDRSAMFSVDAKSLSFFNAVSHRMGKLIRERDV